MVVYDTRIIKLQTIKRMVEACNKEHLPVPKEKLIAYCGKEWGTARQTAQAMFKELEANEEIVVDGDDIWTYFRWQKILVAR